ncbi:MAG: DinB family protein [Chlamydiota bacterium]
MKQTTSPLLIDLIPTHEFNSQIRLYADYSYEGQDALEVLINTTEAMESFITTIPPDKIAYRYGYGKWTVGEVIQHVITYEKIFTDRIQLILDEDAELIVPYYTQASTASPAKGKSKQDLLEEFRDTRTLLIEIIKNTDEDRMREMGSIDGFRASVRALVACASGHQKHHFQVLKDRYGI